MRKFEEWDGAILAELDPVWAQRVIFYESCGSTNDEARRLAQKNERADWLVVLAENQTSGRGRRGQAWHCPAGQGMAVTVVFRPQFEKRIWARLALATGLAVAEALDHFGVFAEVKWPNDVWIGGKKIGGILVEAEGEQVMIGIGLNVNVAGFPPELVDPATSLFLEKGELVRREEVLVMVLRQLEARVAQIERDFPDLLTALSSRCALIDKKIELELAGEKVRGVMRGFGAEGELVLQMENGERRQILQAERIRVGGGDKK